MKIDVVDATHVVEGRLELANGAQSLYMPEIGQRLYVSSYLAPLEGRYLRITVEVIREPKE